MHIYSSQLKYMCLALPSFAEQTAIVEYLDKATADIETDIARARRQIELVEEYRTRLIADVVTGKLDVREEAAKLPDATDASDGRSERDRIGWSYKSNDQQFELVKPQAWPC